MKKPLVSICCLTYNHAPYIRQCLDGFVMQKTDFPIEVLIHDDASTDGTADIIREYEQKYPDIIKPIYQTENQYSKRVPITKTYIYPRLQGKYLATCEGDDCWIDDSFLSDGIMFLEKHEEYNCYATNTIYKRPDSERTGIDVSQYEHIGHDISFNNYLYLHTSARIYRNIFNFSDISRHPYKGEIFLWWMYLEKGKVYFDHKITSIYNASGSGIWSRKTPKEKDKGLFKAHILGEKLFSHNYSTFFWSNLPKNKMLMIIKKFLGIKLTMKLLTLVFFPKYNKNR